MGLENWDREADHTNLRPNKDVLDFEIDAAAAALRAEREVKKKKKKTNMRKKNLAKLKKA